MPDILHGYKITREMSANTCKLFIGQRWNREYVIKQYTGYRFLSPESRRDAGKNLLRAEQRAEKFYSHLQTVMRAMKARCRRSGLLNIPLRVFREGTNIYKVTRYVKNAGIPTAELHNQLKPEQMNVFLKTILCQVQTLSDLRFVHGDIKPENFVITQKRQVFSAALIDYEAGFFVGDGYKGFGTEYTPEYASPEMMAFQRVRRESPDDAEGIESVFRNVGCATDVFSIGCTIIFFMSGQLVTGNGLLSVGIHPSSLMEFGLPVWIPKFHPLWRMLAREALRHDQAQRPEAREMLHAVNDTDRLCMTAFLTHPFLVLKDIGLSGKEHKSACGQLFLMACVEEGGSRKCCAIWHMDDAWCPGEHAKARLLKVQQASGRRRREYVKAVIEKLGACGGGVRSFSEARLIKRNGLCFVMHRIPSVNWITLERYAAESLSPEEADRMMYELLDMVDSLHRQGLLGCMVEKEDIWVMRDSSNVAHPFLARPHRLILQDCLPNSDDVDTRIDIIAPEACLFLGATNDAKRAEMVEMIGPWSDVFSLGAIYHMLLTGDWPDIIDPTLVCLGIAAQPDEGGETGIVYSDRIDGHRLQIIKQMMAFQPGDRLDSCEAVGALIRKPSKPVKADGTTSPKWSVAQDDAKSAKEHYWVSFDAESLQNYVDLTEDGSSDGATIPEVSSDEDDFIVLNSDVQDERAALESPWDEDDFIVLDNVTPDEPSIPEMPSERDDFVFFNDNMKDAGKSEVERYWLIAAVSSKWHLVLDSATGQMLLARPGCGLELDESSLEVIHAMTLVDEHILDFLGIVSIGGLPYALLNMQAEKPRSILVGKMNQEDADRIMIALLNALQIAHAHAVLVPAIEPDDILAFKSEIFIDIAEKGLDMNKDRAIEFWVERMRPRTEALKPWIAPGLDAILSGKSAPRASEAFDSYSVGTLYHTLLCGRPARDAGHMEETIEFSRRWIIAQLLSGDGKTLYRALMALEDLPRHKDQVKTVTVKRNGQSATFEKVKLYAEMDGAIHFVRELETDENGRITYKGPLPALRYFVRCEGVRVPCRWHGEGAYWLAGSIKA